MFTRLQCMFWEPPKKLQSSRDLNTDMAVLALAGEHGPLARQLLGLKARPDGKTSNPACDLQGGLDLNIDMSVLALAGERASLARQLLGPHWRPAQCAHAQPPDAASRKMLTLADYKRRQGIA